MKKRLNFKLFTIVFACILFPLFGCEEDDSQPASSTTPTEENQAMKVGGTISAVVNGELINYPDVQIEIYWLSNMVGIIGIDSVNQETTNQLKVAFPMAPTTGTFISGDPGFLAEYQVITDNNEFGYLYNSGKVSEINLQKHELIGASGDSTFYHVEATFSLSGKYIITGDSVDIDNGVVDFVFADVD